MFNLVKYCGIFTPCENCNIETRSCNCAIVDEAVFSPCRAEDSQAVNESLFASHRLTSCCLATAVNILDDAGGGGVT
jgi:hypothetical protein